MSKASAKRYVLSAWRILDSPHLSSAAYRGDSGRGFGNGVARTFRGINGRFYPERPFCYGALEAGPAERPILAVSHSVSCHMGRRSLDKTLRACAVGIHWLPFRVVGAVVALILAVAQSRPKPHGRQETIEMLERVKQEREVEEIVWVTLNIFFWVLLLTLLVAIVIRYVV